MGKKRVVVVGAGPGGLTAAMILASRGYEVEIFEKQQEVGGRNRRVTLDGAYHFDLGPTFLMMKWILEEVFALTGRNVSDYLDIRSIDPFYRLVFTDGTVLLPTADQDRMRAQLEAVSPGAYKAYLAYHEREKAKFARVAPCLQVPYGSPVDYLSKRFLKAIPHLDAHRSLWSHLGRAFHDDRLKTSFAFQAKYLGMSPWSCPATFSIISYAEHSGGIHHPIGGLNRISQAMARVVEEEGGQIHLGAPVRQLVLENGRAVGVELETGERVLADHVVLNVDFGHAMTHLVPRTALRKWTPETLAKKGYSCSTFMLYFGLDKLYDLPHHNIFFAKDYRKNVREIADTQVLSEDPSFYLQNAGVTDPTLAPPGHSTVYVLVPVANNRSGIDWEGVKAGYREKILGLLESRAGLGDFRQHIVTERMITPRQWEEQTDIYAGATFNLAHTLTQMLHLRPHNQFEEFEDCYLVGGGTHPGSGLPTIFESGRISAGLILKKDAWYL